VVARNRPGGDLALEGRLKWLMSARLLLAGAGIVAILLARSGEAGSFAPYYSLLAACFLNLVYLVLARAGVGLRALAVGQLALDVLLVGALSYFTGIERFFSFLYFGVVIAASVLLGPRMGVGFASASSIALSSVSLIYFLANDDRFALRLPYTDPFVIAEYAARQNFVLPYLFFFALSLHVVALLSGRLTTEVRRVRLLNDEILRNIAGGVLAADPQGFVQFANPPAAALLGLPEGKPVVGRRLEEALPKAVAEFMRHALRSGERAAKEFVQGRTPLRLAVSPVPDAGGPRGVVAVLTDLSLHTRMEEMTRRADRFQALLEMSASMAHEIRNPLASIRGAAQELQTASISREEDRQLLRVVVRESDRLNGIITEFMDYASDRPVNLALCNMAEIVEETVQLLEARGERNVEIETRLPRTLVCRGDADKLKQVLLNLGLNAVEACSGGVKVGHVLFAAQPAAGPEADGREGVRVDVSDDGRGIPRGDQDRIFDPFFTTKSTGIGMGLALARKIVQAHGGEITLKSQEGKGTTVSVWIPA
jgi:two-component system sensor histidine kinase PilS (NtrC family)